MMRKETKKKQAYVRVHEPFAYRREVPKNAVQVPLLSQRRYGEMVTLVGRIMTSNIHLEKSQLGVFETIDDAEVISLEKIQGDGSSIPAYALQNDENTETVNNKLDFGDVVLLKGVKKLFGGIDVFVAEKIQILTKIDTDVYDHDINIDARETMYTHRYLQIMRNPEQLTQFKKCSAVLKTIREFLYKRGYDEVNITLLQEHFEAGLANPFTVHTNDLGKDMYLRVTAELFMRKLMIAGFSKVFEINKSFRNQGSTQGTVPQFTILELYRAYAGEEEMENLMIDMIREILIQIHGSPILPSDEGWIDCSGVWNIYDFREEVKKCAGKDYDEHSPLEDRALLLDSCNIKRPEYLNDYTVAKALYGGIMSTIKGPAFLRNLPAAQSPLFKMNDDASTVDETVLVINGRLVADIVNPERDLSLLTERLARHSALRSDKPTSGGNEDFLTAMKYGLPPCRGIGMGIERLLMIVLNKKDIRDVEFFPIF